MRDLPPFLETAMRDHEGGQAVISDVRVRIQVDGFFSFDSGATKLSTCSNSEMTSNLDRC